MKVKTETIIRTIVLILALANNVLAIYGKEKIPITEDHHDLHSLMGMVEKQQLYAAGDQSR